MEGALMGEMRRAIAWEEQQRQKQGPLRIYGCDCRVCNRRCEAGA